MKTPGAPRREPERHNSQGTVPSSVDEYLEGVPEEGRAAFEKLRAVVKAAAPDAVEIISYRIPTFK